MALSGSHTEELGSLELTMVPSLCCLFLSLVSHHSVTRSGGRQSPCLLPSFDKSLNISALSQSVDAAV